MFLLYILNIYLYNILMLVPNCLEVIMGPSWWSNVCICLINFQGKYWLKESQRNGNHEEEKSLWNLTRSKYWRRRQNDKNLILQLIFYGGNIFEAQAFFFISRSLLLLLLLLLAVFLQQQQQRQQQVVVYCGLFVVFFGFKTRIVFLNDSWCEFLKYTCHLLFW